MKGVMEDQLLFPIIQLVKLDLVILSLVEFDIFVKKQETNFATKILFRNVPLNVPDEEIVNLTL